MSEADQVTILKAEHAELENALEQEKHKLQPDHIAVSAIKKRKLRIKDQLAAIEAHP
ncbi:MAG: YdcH family protein [Pseudomonadota bacterium]|nr:YdcH family protein [Pseudomonadota bacterium]